MQRIQTDPIIAEVSIVRDEHAARFGYDVDEIFRDIRAMQDASGSDYVRDPARRTSSAYGSRMTSDASLGFLLREAEGAIHL